VFTFAGSDIGGSSNVASLDISFSAAGDDGSGVGGPAAPVCHFLYIPNMHMVYMDGPDGLYNWLGSSIVGTGGLNLTNADPNSHWPANCTVHLGSPNVPNPIKFEPKVLSLTLDIEFVASLSPKKHMYVVVQNANYPSQASNGGNWKYWGWWATP
jgi:hypothetical protein